MRPRIGIDLDHEHDGRRWIYKLPAAYAAAVVAAGAEPVPILPADPRPPAEILDGLDGLLMTGGDDVHPALLGRTAGDLPMTLLTVQRERFVLALARAVLATPALPCLAVCLGMQALNLAAGGDLWLDLGAERPGSAEHRDGARHRIDPEPGGRLARWWRDRPQTLPSHHHQALRRVGEGLVVEARAEDGIVEAVAAEDRPFLLGLQWHPEIQEDGPGGRPLVERLVEAASRRG
ncbi:MAG: gamma-glutamyl-gamma-aminobutyrate hydrolase family protein [Planctomycetota bacterium]